MKISVLIENTKGEMTDNLIAEPGLSLHVSFNGKQILFDAGISGAFAKNAHHMDIDLSAVQVAVLSHHHFDHGGGLPRFLEMNSKAKIYLRKAPEGRTYFRTRFLLRKYIGLNQNMFKTHAGRFEFIETCNEILPDVFLLTHIKNSHPKPNGNKYLYLKNKSGWRLDTLQHELIMAIKEDGKLVVFSGCSHNGILNIIETVVEKFAGVPIKAIVGGFHLIVLPILNTLAGSRRDIEEIGNKALHYPVESFYTGHCTGQKAYHVLKDIMGEQIQQLYTGRFIEI